MRTWSGPAGRLVVWIAVVLLAAVMGSSAAHASEEVSFTTDDGFKLVGDFYDAGAGAPVVILLHQLGSDRSEMRSFISLLTNNGFTVLAYDARGHGQSTEKNGKTVSWKDFGDYDFADMGLDISAAVDFLDLREGRGYKLGLLGSSIQSSTALVYAANHEDVAALVMLSPGLDYKGIDTRGPMSLYSGRPVFMAASNGDQTSFESMTALKVLAGDKCIAYEVNGDAHGVALCDSDPTLNLKIEDWLARQLK
jgi:pimeloyl-ACP methyl ester carboxylesterase